MIRLTDYTLAVPFFAGRHDTLIRSCLEGFQGSIWADNAENPQTLVMISCDFTFFAGIPTPKVFSEFPWAETDGYTIFTPPDAEWEALITAAYPAVKPWERFAICYEPEKLDKTRLEACVRALPEGFTLRQIDEELYRETFRQEWSRDFCSHFTDFAEFDRLACGFCILHDGKIVSGCSAYARYSDGIELEVDTDPAYFRRGLARACAAAMMLECLKRGLYPSWDASGMISVQLAESLGYHRAEAYRCYWVDAPAV